METKDTQGSGNGLFVMEDVKKGDYIIEYVGRIVYKEQDNVYGMKISDMDLWIDPTSTGCPAKYMNHSEKKNHIAPPPRRLLPPPLREQRQRQRRLQRAPRGLYPPPLREQRQKETIPKKAPIPKSPQLQLLESQPHKRGEGRRLL